MQVAREPLEIADRAEMGLHDPPRSIREQPVDRAVQRVGVELHRRRRRQHERSGGGVELAVADAEIVAGVDVAVVEVDRAVVMPRVARRIDELERASAERSRMPSAINSTRSAGIGMISPYSWAEHRLPVDGDRAGDELGWIDRCGAPRGCSTALALGSASIIWPGAARVIEMHVCQEQVVDLLARDAEFVERRQQPGRGRAGTRIDEGGASLVHHQVAGGEPRSHVLRVDQVEAIDQRLGNAAFVHEVMPGTGGRAHWPSHLPVSRISSVAHRPGRCAE